MTRDGRGQSGRRRCLTRLARHQWWLLAVLALLAVLLGWYGYWQYYHVALTPAAFASVLYFAVQLASFGSTVGPTHVPWTLTVARFLLPAVVLYAAIRGGLVLFDRQLQAWHAWRMRGHTIVCGLGTTGLFIVRRLCERHERVVVLEADASHGHIPLARDAGAVVALGDARNQDVLRRVGINRARRLVITTGSDEENAAIAASARSIVTDEYGALQCHLLVHDFDLFEALGEQRFRGSKAQSFWLELVNLHDRAARAALREYWAENAASSGDARPRHFAIHGSGHMLHSLVCCAASQRMSDASPDARVRITLLAPTACDLAAELERRYPKVAVSCDLRALPLDEPQSLRRALAQHPEDTDFDCVFVSDEGDWSTALRLEQELRVAGTPVVLLTHESSGISRLLGQAGPSAGGIVLRIVPILEVACDPDVLFGGVNEVLARAIHQRFVGLHGASGPDDTGSVDLRALRPWNELDEDLRDQNRAQAADILGKLQSIGCDLAPTGSAPGGRFDFTPEELEMLSEREHARWMATKRAQGWKLGPSRDATRRLHPDLRPWTELDDATKQKDRDTVLQMPDLVALAGYAIWRSRTHSRKSHSTDGGEVAGLAAEAAPRGTP